MPNETRDLLIAATETNTHHGVGILLQRLFPDSTEFACVRTTSLYNGEESFGGAHHELCSRTLTLAETEEHLRRIISLYKIRRILCVPYYREEFVHAVLAKKITGAPLCTYLMDDQNIFAPHVPDHWVSDALAASDLRLGISPEMCAAYEKKYGRAVHLLPPLLETPALLVPCYWDRADATPLRAAMIGNVWTSRRFEQLRLLLRETGLHLDWYGNGPLARWLPGTPEDWEADNIRCLGYFPEEDLVASLASYPFVLVPSGNLDADDDHAALARLSLPSRLLFLHARTDTPVMLLGSPDTAAGRFITHLGTGVCAPFEPAAFKRELARLLDPGEHERLRSNVRNCAPALVFPDAGKWIWDSLAHGKAMPADFQRLFPGGYLDSMPGLDTITPARPRPVRNHPKPEENFRDEHAASFAFLRNRHLAVLAAARLELPAVEDLEPSLLNGAVTRYILEGALPRGGDVLFLGSEIQPHLNQLPPGFRLWQIASLEAWQRAGYAGDPSHITGAGRSESYPRPFPQFDAIVSTYWCGQLGDDPHVKEGLSLYLEGCTAPGGMNLHFFTAVLQPAYFWTGPLYGYLRDRFLRGSDWPGMDELLAADDPFIMSESVYNQHWKPLTGRTYAAFGKPLSLGLFWRNAS